MSRADLKEKIRNYDQLRAWLRGDGAVPLVIEGSIATCVCDAVSWTVWLRMFTRYLVVSLAGIVPVSSVKIGLLRLLGAHIGRGVFISPGVVFDPLFPELISIGNDVLLGLGCRLITHEYTATNFRLGRIRIGDGSVIGAWAMVRSGVTIGAKVTVGACSFVNRDAADGETVAGVPARAIPPKDAAA